MRGEIIAEEYNKMVWVRDENGREFACYAKDVRSTDTITDKEKKHCLDTSDVLGDSW